MIKEIKEKWVEALRSGLYEKGTHTLRDSKDCFCVMGVLCDLHKEDTGAGEWEGPYYRTESELDRHLLTPEVLEWAGIEREPGQRGIYVESMGCHLHQLNDGSTPRFNFKAYSFEELAEIIETNL